MNEAKRILEIIRDQGERITIQRRLVIEALTSTRDHMTIGDIRQYIEQRTHDDVLAEPTIYRILQWLKDLGVVAQTDMAQSGVVYQIIGATPHHHLICLNCGRTTELPDALFDDLRAQLERDYRFRARIDHMAIYGYCENCPRAE